MVTVLGERLLGSGLLLLALLVWLGLEDHGAQQPKPAPRQRPTPPRSERHSRTGSAAFAELLKAQG
jgi:hypothetical protein